MRERIRGFAENLEREVAQRPWWWVGFFTVLYTSITVLRAASKPLWFDELFTVYVARLPSIREMWSALASGFDPNPPLPYLLTRLSHVLLGEGPVTTRLPAMLGLWLMCVCVFWFVRRRTCALHAAVAMTLPLVTSAYSYACEARGYGLVLGSSALSLVCWQSVEGRRRWLALVGLALSVALGVSSHYYAVLILIPLGLAEVCRSIARKRIDPPVWLMIVVGLAPLGAYLPLIRSGIAQVAGYSSRIEQLKEPALSRVAEYYSHLLSPALPAVVLGLALLVVAADAGLLGGRTGDQGPHSRLPLHDLVAVGGFLFLPVFLYALAVVATKQYMDRYALSAVVGCATLMGMLMRETARSKPVVGIIALSSFLVCFVAAQFLPRTELYALRSPVLDSKDMMYPGGDDRPIAVANPLQYLPMYHYGSPKVVSRIRYLSDPRRAVRQPDFIADLALRGLRQWMAVQVEDYQSFLGAHGSFWVYQDSSNQLEWLIPALVAEGWRVELRRQDRDLMLFLVTRGHAEAPGAKDCADGRRAVTATEGAAARNGALP